MRIRGRTIGGARQGVHESPAEAAGSDAHHARQRLQAIGIPSHLDDYGPGTHSFPSGRAI